MALAINLDEVKGNEFKTLEAGNYVGVIRSVEYVPLDNNKGTGNYINVDWEITEGPLTGYAGELNEKFGFWPLTFSLSLKESVAWKFKNFINAIEDYDYKANCKGKEWDEHSIEGKDFGISIQMEHYIGNNDKEKTRLARWGNHIFGTPDKARAGELKKVDDAYKEEVSTLNAAAAWLTNEEGDSFEKADADNPFA